MFRVYLVSVHKRYYTYDTTQRKTLNDEEVKKNMKQTNPQVFTVDLARIDGNGDFPCPYCGVSISPEDTTDSVYTIVDTQMNGEALEELTIQCNKCGSKIRLVGFV